MNQSAKQVYQAGGFGHPISLESPFALLVIDFCNAFVDPTLLGGGNIEQAAHNTRRVLQEARGRGWPIAHSKIAYRADGSDANIWVDKVPRLKLLTEDSHAADFITPLYPAPGELVIQKTIPSAFFASSLAEWFGSHGINSVLIAGCTTSGCVRASVVDALSLGLRSAVLADCVGDRSVDSHHASLTDIAAKYAEVITADALFAQVVGDTSSA